MRKAVCAAIIGADGLLIVQKGDYWILPGGKPEPKEEDNDLKKCLERELKEELPNLILKDPRYLGAFIGITPYKRDELQAEVYLASATGEINPSAEIKALEWTKNPEGFNLSDITKKIVSFLRKNSHL